MSRRCQHSFPGIEGKTKGAGAIGPVWDPSRVVRAPVDVDDGRAYDHAPLQSLEGYEPSAGRVGKQMYLRTLKGEKALLIDEAIKEDTDEEFDQF